MIDIADQSMTAPVEVAVDNGGQVGVNPLVDDGSESLSIVADQFHLIIPTTAFLGQCLSDCRVWG
jgi:hypothetical protein